jgi:hypothetical protein
MWHKRGRAWQKNQNVCHLMKDMWQKIQDVCNNAACAPCNGLGVPKMDLVCKTMSAAVMRQQKKHRLYSECFTINYISGRFLGYRETFCVFQ